LENDSSVAKGSAYVQSFSYNAQAFLRGISHTANLLCQYVQAVGLFYKIIMLLI